MIQGTGSNVGKSLIAAGLCRLLRRQGYSVRPFKPQNMSNNAAVTSDGGEIGRAQALQARACGVPPSRHMNPVLLKPQSDRSAQVIVQGQVHTSTTGRGYLEIRHQFLPLVLESFHRMCREADFVIVEGAGSPAEVNLRAGDISNMGFAEAADVPVVLIGDIDRGGVIASLIGTWELLDPSERARICGFLINRFRGDVRLFDNGLQIISARTGMRSFGVVPWFAQADSLPAEDSVALESRQRQEIGATAIKIVVPRLPRISNFDDLDPLRAEPDVSVIFVHAGEVIPATADIVLIPGSKATIADLAFIREQGWDIDLRAHVRRGGTAVGLCGGYQMLGRVIEDPDGIEGPPGSVSGLGFLDIETTLSDVKTLINVEGIELTTRERIQGYEMHMGQTRGPGLAKPMLDLDGRPDGAITENGRVFGCYVHGLFAADGFRHAFLNRIRARQRAGIDYEAMVEQTLDALADHLENHLDCTALTDCAKEVAAAA